MPCNCNKDRSPRYKKSSRSNRTRSSRSHQNRSHKTRSRQTRNNKTSTVRNVVPTAPVPRVTTTPVSSVPPVARAVPTPVSRAVPTPVSRAVSSVPPTNHVVLQNNYTRYIQARQTQNRNQTRNQNKQIQTRQIQNRYNQNRNQLAQYHRKHNEASQYRNVQRSELRSWDKIHRMAVNATTDELVKEFTEYMEYLGNNFPCPKCRPHIQKRLKDHPVSNYYGTKDKDGKEIGVAKWSWEFHNAVNQRLKKNIVTWDSFVSKYY